MIIRRLCMACALVCVPLCAEYASAQGTAKPKAVVSYAFELNDADRTKLIDGVKSLTYGEPIAQAKKILGEPNSEKDLIRPTLESLLFGVFGAKPIFVAHQLSYDIKLVDLNNGSNSYQHSNIDQTIELMFDSSGHLQNIVYSSMKPVSGEIIDQSIQPAYGFEYYRTKPPMPEPATK